VLDQWYWISGGPGCETGNYEGVKNARPLGIREQNVERGVRAQQHGAVPPVRWKKRAGRLDWTVKQQHQLSQAAAVQHTTFPYKRRRKWPHSRLNFGRKRFVHQQAWAGNHRYAEGNRFWSWKNTNEWYSHNWWKHNPRRHSFLNNSQRKRWLFSTSF